MEQSAVLVFVGVGVIKENLKRSYILHSLSEGEKTILKTWVSITSIVSNVVCL